MYIYISRHIALHSIVNNNCVLMNNTLLEALKIKKSGHQIFAFYLRQSYVIL